MITLAERRWLPDSVIRVGIRRLLRRRLRQETFNADRTDSEAALAETLREGPITVSADAANEQHYEVPAEFFECVLGRHLKYSCGYWRNADTSLDESESAMLRLTCDRAEIQDGMSILELGCGWGSLTLWMAQQYPNAQVTAVSNSHSQREYILSKAEQRGLHNLEVITCDMAEFATTRKFDRVVSVEMFEHVRNHAHLLKRIASWLNPEGQLFVHIFCHRQLAYLFQPEGRSDWMARHFFTGGMMPSRDWFRRFDEDLRIEQQWTVDGTHYQRTSEAWLGRLDANCDQLQELFQRDLSVERSQRQLQRWRMFLMACAELFGFNHGQEWFVEHYRMTHA